MWAPRVSAMVGAFTPSVPVDHQHVALEAVPGHELPHDTPCFRDPHNLVYGKAEAGGVLLGGYEPDPVSRWVDGVPWEHGSTTVASSEDRFSIIMDGAIRRFPFLRDAGMVKLVCHPDAMTPDGNPLLGPMPGVPGFWTAAGLSLNGFGGAGGMGKTIAEWITTGETEIDVHSYRPWRFSDVYRHPGLTDAGGREVYRYYYRLRYPLDTDRVGPAAPASARFTGVSRSSARCSGSRTAGSGPTTSSPGGRARRAGEDQRAFGWAKPPYLDLLRAEHEAVRERVGILDMTSFGKIEVSGPGALALLERVSDNRIDRPVGAVVYTQFLNPRGGIVADVTVTRLAERALPRRDRCGRRRLGPRLATPPASRRGGRRHPRCHRRAGGDRPLGPAARDGPAARSPRRRLARGVPFGTREDDLDRWRPGCWRSASRTSASSAASSTSRQTRPCRSGTA